MKSLVQQYLATGWKLCRISPGTKGPRDKEWNVAGHEIRTPEGFPLGYGVGLLHAWSGTMALDIDNYPVARAWLLERGVDLDELMNADDAVQIVSGRADSAKLLYRCASRQSATCAEYASTNKNGEPITKSALDFRCASGTGNTVQDALPPTVHPGRGLPYEWALGPFAAWQYPPPLPSSLEAIWDELILPATTALPQVAVPSGAAPTQIEAWLKTQDPGMCRNDWIVIGMKLHAEYQAAPAGFEVWQKWSAGSPKWDDVARQSMWGIWKGFKLEGRALATLDSDLRSMPAEATEFEFVPPDRSGATTTLNSLVETEPAEHRENRELMQDYVVLLTSAAMPYYLLPGHPNPKLKIAAGNTGVDLTFNQFNALMAPYLKPVPTGTRGIPMKPHASDVIADAGWRHEAKIKAFRPGGDWLYSEDDGHNYLNAWRGKEIEPVKPTEREIEPLEWLLRRVLDDHGKAGNVGDFQIWLCRLYSYVLQNPGIKVKWAPLLYSKMPGTGKTTLMQTIPEILFGDQFVLPMTHEVLRTPFATAEFNIKWWVHIAEMHSDAGKVDARFIANKLKPWITDRNIIIHPKNINAHSVRNYLQFTASSNDEDALYLEEDAEDRRWLVGQMLNIALTTEEKAFLNPLFGDERNPKAAGWLKYWFMERDLREFSPDESPPSTMAKKKVQLQSRSVWEDKVFAAFEDGAPPFDKDVVRPRDLTEGLLIRYNITLSQAKRLLEKIGAVEMKRTDDDRSLYCVRNGALWAQAKPHEVKEHLRSGVRPVDDGADLL